MTKPAPLGTLIDSLALIREKRRKLEEQDKILKAQYTEVEAEILALMKEQGTDKVTGKKATASVSTVTVANVTDWDAFYAFIYKNKMGYLLQRRVSDPAFRELLESKGDKALEKVGLVPFVKTNLNLRLAS